jgi:hypothetical protein
MLSLHLLHGDNLTVRLTAGGKWRAWACAVDIWFNIEQKERPVRYLFLGRPPIVMSE